MATPPTNPFAVRELFNDRHLFDSGNFNLYGSGDSVNLSAGAPGPEQLTKCCDLFVEATKHRMEFEKTDDALLFQYGPAVGKTEYRTSVAQFLSKNYRDVVDSNDIVQTTGASQGLHYILTLLIDLNGVIFVDEITFMVALDVFKHFPGLKVISVPLTADGADVEHFRRVVSEHRFESTDGKMFWGMYYTIPVHQNPTGVSFTADVCQEIVNVAREFDLLIFAEDVYNLLTYDTVSGPPKRLFAYDRMSDAAYKGNVISNGTFSKILSPGARIGWMEVPPRCIRFMNASGLMQSGGASNNYMAGIMTSAFELKLLQKFFDDLLNEFGERMRMAVSVLKEQLPTSCTFVAPTGGYFIWITLPEHIVCTELNAYSEKYHNVTGVSGHYFSADGKFRNCLRLAISFYGTERLKAALERLCTAIHEFLAKNQQLSHSTHF